MHRIRFQLPEKELATFRIPIRITDLNYGNHVSNNAIVEILHEARMQFLGCHGFTEMEVAGTSLIMSELVVEYKNESFYGDIIEVKISSGEVSKVAFELYYNLETNRDGKTLAIAAAKTGMVCYDYGRKKIDVLPLPLRNILTL